MKKIMIVDDESDQIFTIKTEDKEIKVPKISIIEQ